MISDIIHYVISGDIVCLSSKSQGCMKDPGLIFSDFTQNCEEACSVIRSGPMDSVILILLS